MAGAPARAISLENQILQPDAAPVYQKAIALMGRQIDGGGQAAER